MNKLTYKYVKEYIETEGYKLLSDEYKNNKTKLELQCPEGHKFKMNWDCFKRGQRCSKCKDTRFTYELVSVMTFSKLSLAKGNKVFTDNEYELSRFCNNFNYIVIGGASKLFKYFIRNYKPKSIISFSDRRWSDGNLYKKLGFEFQYNTSLCYYYIINGQRKHRFIYRKSELKNKLEIFDPKLTEYQNMINNGFDRIWDCGNSKWLWKRQL